jgi:hypothetical protein
MDLVTSGLWGILADQKQPAIGAARRLGVSQGAKQARWVNRACPPVVTARGRNRSRQKRQNVRSTPSSAQSPLVDWCRNHNTN